MRLRAEVVTRERAVRARRGVEVLVAPAWEARLAILPHPAALMTTLDPGELLIRRAQQEDIFAISGGFMEVSKDHVTILADASEPAEEIDIQRAEAARARAEDRLRRAREQNVRDVDMARASAALKRSLVRLQVAQRRRRPGAPRV